MAQRHFPKRSSVRVDQNEVAWGVSPNYNGPWLQIAQTNNEIVRQSSKSDWESEAGLGDIGNENNIRHVYSECSAINRTNEYMINNMTGDNGVLSHVGGGVHSNCTNAVRFPRWMHNSDYDIIGADRSTNKKLIKANVLTGVETVLADFSAYDSMTVGNSQGSGDTLDDRFALTIKDGNDLIVVVWSLVTGAEITRRTFANEWAILDNVTISSLGNYCIKGINNGTDYAVYRCSDLQYVHGAGDAGHGVMALDSNGIDEYWVSISWSGTYRTIRKVHLGTGVDTILLGDGTSQFSNGGATGYESIAGHLGFAPLRPGYVLWSNNDPEGPYTVAWLPMDGSQEIEWLCDHNSEYGSGYWSEPQASASIDGTQIVFASDEQTLNGEINSFVVRAMASKSPDITTTEFTVAQDAANGTVVGQLAATYNGSSVTSDWRLHNSVNTAFAVSDSGVITVADSSQIGSAGTQTIDVIVEGVDGQTAEYITINVVSSGTPPMGGQNYRYQIVVGGGRQSFDALTGNLAGSTLAAVGNLPQTVANKTQLGHYMHIGASYGLGFEGRKTQTMANLQAYLLNDDFEGGLFHLYWKDQDKYAPFIQELLNAARPYGKQILIDYSDIRFNANGLSLSDTPVPQYVKDEGRVTFSGNASNQAICSSMATDPICAGYWISSFEAFDIWDNDPAFGGIMTPETTRSSSAAAGGPYTNIGDGMTDLFMDLIDLVKPKLQKTTLIISINFTDGGNVKFRELFNKAAATGGVAITHPDTVEERDPARLGGVVDYAYDHYNVMREFSDIVLIAACMQTRDIDANIDDCLELVLAKIGVFPRSLQANIIIHYDWHPDYSGWAATMVAKVRAWNAAYHTTIPTSMDYVSSDALINGSDQLAHGTAYKNGQNVDILPNDTASIGDLDSLSIFTTYAGTTTESIEYFEYIEGVAAPVSDGAPIEREFHSYEVGSGAYSVTSSHATRKWSVNNTAIAGYSGSGYLQAEGYNNIPDVNLGGVQRIPLSDLTSGTSFKAWNRVRAENGSTDSFWALKEGHQPQVGGDTFVTSALHGDWNWVPARDSTGDVLILLSSDKAYIGAVREKDLKWSKTIFIDANESAVPTGKDGFYYLNSKVNDDQFNVAANQVGVSLDVLANDDSELTLADIVGAPDHGQASIDVGNNVILYSPDNGYIGEDSISYRAQDVDNNYYTAFASITVSVTPPPITNAITITDNAAGDLVVDFGAYSSSPTGLDLTLSHYPEFPQYYTTSVTGLVVTYTSLVAPPVSFGGNYSITDSAGNWVSNSIIVTRLVTGNIDPTPATDTVITPAGVPVVITPLSNDIDPDGHELTLLGLVNEPSNGTAIIDGNSITYVSNVGFGGLEVLTYTVRDIYGASAEGTIKIAVVGPNGVGVRVGGVITATIRVQSK